MKIWVDVLSPPPIGADNLPLFGHPIFEEELSDNRDDTSLLDLVSG